MADFSVVPGTPFVVGGALGDHAGVMQLYAAGVRSVIDCQREFDDGALIIQRPGLSYVWLPVDDDGQPKPVSWFAAGLEAARSHPLGLLYVHCAAGVNRGPSMCYFLMRALLHEDAATAEARIRAARPQVGLRYKADADAAIIQLKLA